ncbi:MAG: hypothetical protein ACXACP_08610 [Candidatus Hodarchaeales archaeon]
MQYRNLGKTGFEVSRLCLSCFPFGNRQQRQLEIEEARPIVEKALDLGINFLISPIYIHSVDARR